MRASFLLRSNEPQMGLVFLGVVLLLLALLSIRRRYRWNREGFFLLSHRRWYLALFLFLVLYTVSVLMAHDAVVFWPQLTPVREQVNLWIWRDVSLSTLARDVYVRMEKKAEDAPRLISRLTFSQMLLDDFLPFTLGNHVFFGIFGDKAFPVVPLKHLKDEKELLAFRTELEQITEKTISRMEQGTNIGSVLFTTAGLIPTEMVERRTRCVPNVVIIFTDGEPVGNQQELAKDLERGLDRLRRIRCVSIYLVGIGDPDKPSFIPVLDEVGRPTGQYATDSKGIIMTRPNFKFLEEIARSLSGEFIKGRSGSELGTKLKEMLTREKRIIGYKEETKEFPAVWFLAWLTLFLLILLNPFRSPLEG